MKLFRRYPEKKQRRDGFSLVESTFSIGLFSFGLLSLIPLLALGLKSARQARDDRAAAQIARTLMYKAEQGTLALTSGSVSIPFDDQGDVITSPQLAVYVATYSPQPIGLTPLTQITMKIVPHGAPDRPRIYAVVIPTPPAPGS
jgi:type II secretory pathway pseudopilin PulG